MPLNLVLFKSQLPVWKGQLEDRLEIGRQDVSNGPPEPEPYCQVDCGGGPRVIIAEKTERAISRRHAQLAVDGNLITVRNLSTSQPIRCDSGMLIGPGEETKLVVHRAVHLQFADRVLRIETPAAADGAALHSLAAPTLAPGQQSVMAPESLASLRLDKLEDASPDTMMSWLSDAIDVLQSAASSPDFLQEAAQAVVDIVQLDAGQVLRYENGQWSRAGVCRARGEPEDETPVASSIILDRVLQERKTFWQVPDPQDSSESLLGVVTVIASPILNSQGEVIGAIYGDRRTGVGGRMVTKLEARMVEVLACAVASGLARLAQEEAAMAARLAEAEVRTKLGQFFSPMLAELLRERPELLDGQDVEVSVLFCDVRGFSTVGERLEPRLMINWINDTLGLLSDCVIEHGGVLVDYVGDELMAMWGAPVLQQDHAQRACRAALDMTRRLPEIDRQWEQAIGMPTRVGIGVSSGRARVGNTGSHRKFKYGPLGNTVNLGSRVQGCTKWLQCSPLITQYTAERLGEEFAARRLCRVRVVNMQEPVMLLELAVDPPSQWKELQQQYEEALQAFAAGEFLNATQILGGLLKSHPGDGPSMLLLSRTVEALQQPGDFDDVWTLPGK